MLHEFPKDLRAKAARFTLADHRAERKAWLTAILDLPATDPARYR